MAPLSDHVSVCRIAGQVPFIFSFMHVSPYMALTCNAADPRLLLLPFQVEGEGLMQEMLLNLIPEGRAEVQKGASWHK